MHGGVKVYRGYARGAREYLDQDCPRVEDYYLAEPEAFAQRYTVDSDGHVIELARMDGGAYEAWVAGVDPETAEPRGRLRHDARAVRFVEVAVNGPKSWSLAAELHPDVAAAYDAAQDRAAKQIIGWLGQHATARVGPRGQQMATAVEMLEAVTVRHHASRAGDPHRHLHLQINARVFAKGRWRGLDTVAIRDSIAAINGIGHAAVVTDPAFRDALAAHGYTLTGSAGDHPARPLRRSVQQAGGADRAQPRPLREDMAGRTSRGGTRAGVASGVGRAGVGGGPAGQDRPHLVERCPRPVAR